MTEGGLMDAYWKNYEDCLDKIKDEGSTVDDVVRICNEHFDPSSGDAFFPNGADRDLLGTLYEHGGWHTTKYEADYHFTIADMNGRKFEFCEGDILVDPKSQRTLDREATNA